MNAIAHRTADIEGHKIFYREAGPRDAPALLLLHGFPTSSHMFRNLIPALADAYRVIAPGAEQPSLARTSQCAPSPRAVHGNVNCVASALRHNAIIFFRRETTA